MTRQEVKSSAQGEAESYDVTRSVYDSRNRLIAVISEPSEGQTEVVRYTYDAAGRLLSMATGLTSLTEEVNPAVHSVTTYAYDDLGSVVSETDALGKATTYTYDLLGNVLTKTDRNGTVFTYTYDALGRNTAMTAQNGEQTQTASYTYDYLGNVTRVVDNGQEIVYTYDVRGNLLTETVGDVVKTYAYDANGNRTSFVLAEGLGEAAVEKQNLTYAYDTIGRLMSVTNGAEVTAYTYDANHNLTAETTGTAGQTPVRSVAYTYNKANLLTGKTNTQNGTVAETYTATYFANGNKASVTENNDTTQYTYDGMGRLLTETEGDTATVYTYTQSGNRATKIVTADGVTTQTATYAYDKNNRLTKEQSTQDGQTVVTGYTYDHNGNQIIKNAMVLSSEGGARSFALGENNNSTEFFTYDLRNRLTQYKNGDTKASYTYGADGFRNAKTVNGVTTSFIYDGANIVETKQGETVTDYIRGIGLIKYTDSTTTAYYFTDDHGSTSSLYGADGTKLSDYTYDAFGNEEQVSSTDTNPFRYCGEYTDQESGLVYLRARYYDPQTGRFISEDPAKDGLNWYVYCANNPIMFVDPWGLFDEDEKLGVSAQYDDDVLILQNELALRGYYSGEINGYFEAETLNAVNAYKNDMGLWNYGEYEGVVGLTTWTSLGLIYRTYEDIEAGVEIWTDVEYKCQYYDVTKPFTNLLISAKNLAENHKHNFLWFYLKVNHNADWDIKRPGPWLRTLGISYPGSNDSIIIVSDYYSTPEQLGNFLYGYAGAGAGFGTQTLLLGSIYASNVWKNGTKDELMDEFNNDHYYIKKGIEYYAKQ